MAPSVLIVTIPPLDGGVPVKARILAEHLRARAHPVTVAHYATLSDFPDLVAPSWRMATGKRAASRAGTCFGGFPSVAVGCALPEMEFMYYRPSPRWRAVIENHDRHIAVGGTTLVSYPLTAMGIPHLVWCASTMHEDRVDRRRSMPAPRKVFDRLVVGPVQRTMEKRILAGPGFFMTVSAHARKTLIEAGGKPERFVGLAVPVDAERFTPPSVRPDPAVIGFAGRPNDPRKNIPLLLEAVRILSQRGCDVELRLTGDPTGPLQGTAARMGISDRVRWQGWLAEDALAGFFQSLNVFVIPSLREGLNIAGVQAMACGVPVISTRCGGPEDYVIEGVTGFLVDFDAGRLADRLQGLIEDRGLRDDLGQNARRKALEDYSHGGFRERLDMAWHSAWGERPAP